MYFRKRDHNRKIFFFCQLLSDKFFFPPVEDFIDSEQTSPMLKKPRTNSFAIYKSTGANSGRKSSTEVEKLKPKVRKS